jgi:hypothetical protein
MMHESHWALDGSIVLQIENYLFKQHRSRLVEQSQVLAAIFEQEGALVGENGGCPVYKIDNVQAADYVTLLDIMDHAV